LPAIGRTWKCPLEAGASGERGGATTERDQRGHGDELALLAELAARMKAGVLLGQLQGPCGGLLERESRLAQ
jgi:hypothetical protein